MLTNPARPFVVMMGGAKLSTKLRVIQKLLPKIDSLLIGGAMAFTFMQAKGIGVGKSMVEPDYIATAARLLAQYPDKIVLPCDVVGSAGQEHSYPVRYNVVGCDIGKATVGKFQEYLDTAETIFGNGPMGMYELAKFRWGTEWLTINMIERWFKAKRIVGGGDIIAAYEKEHLLQRFADSGGIALTAGGAALEFIQKFGSGEELPTIAALKQNTKEHSFTWWPDPNLDIW